MIVNIKKLKGYSGSEVLLMQDQKPFVRKIGDIDRNLERYAVLSNLGLSTPDILHKEDTFYDMEYIPNLDIKTYLLTHQVSDIFNFIKDTIQILNKKSFDKDYTSVYHKKLTSINFTDLIFTKDELIDRLPKILPSSDYHGDFTLENILYNTITKKFILIDPLTTEYDSYVFDLAKLRQDVECGWFIRKSTISIYSKLTDLSERLNDQFDHYSNYYILILMLLRVLPYTQGEDRKFIIEKVNKLWK